MANIFKHNTKKFIDGEQDKLRENNNFSTKLKFTHDLLINNSQNNNNNKFYNYNDESKSNRPKKGASNSKGDNKKKSKDKKKKVIEWKQRCYICNDFGDLICCEECQNVVHLFCATLNVKY